MADIVMASGVMGGGGNVGNVRVEGVRRGHGMMRSHDKGPGLIGDWGDLGLREQGHEMRGPGLIGDWGDPWRGLIEDLGLRGGWGCGLWRPQQKEMQGCSIGAAECGGPRHQPGPPGS